MGRVVLRAPRRLGVPRRRGYLPRVNYRGFLGLSNIGQYLNAFNTFSIGNTLSAVSLCTPNQGTGTNTRIGDRIVMKEWHVRFTILPGTSQVTPTTVRCMIVYDKQSDGGLPGGNQPLTAADPYAHYDLTTQDRFIIVKDELFTVGAIADADQAFARIKPVHWHGKCSLQAKFTNTGGGLADCSNGSFLFMQICEIASGGNLSPRMYNSTAVKYLM